MKILNLTLENFRGIKNLAIDFQGKDTDIFGANGLGKTTIANAICWLLIDRPATEEPSFDPKTTGAHGIHHVATITIKMESGQEITFGKDYFEKYTKKKGQPKSEVTGNTTDYYIDGVKTKKKDYTLAVEQACGICSEKMKMLLVLGYFADEMTTDEKRKILFELAEEFTDEDVLNANESLQELRRYLLMQGTSNKFYTIAQWESIAKEKRRKLNKDLELLPARIDEANRNIPETVADITALNNRLQSLEAQKTEIETEIRSLQTPDGQQDATRAEIAKLNTQLETQRAAYIKQGADANFEISGAICETEKECFSLAADCDNAEHRREYAVKERDRMNAQRKQLMEEYAAVQAEQWNATDEICPTCGQPLPPSKVDEARAAFNQRKSQKKEEINRRGQECSKEKIAAKEAEISRFDRDIEEAKKKLADAKQRLANLRDTQITQPPFETTEEYAALRQQIDALKQQSQEANIPTAEIQAKTADLQHVKADIQSTTMEIAKAKAAEESRQRVAELQKERHETTEQLEDTERGLHLCDEFTRIKTGLVTESVNKHFRLVRFILFRDQMNGGIQPVCEPTVKNRDKQWVEYRSVNYADKVNAKLDVVDTLNRHYGVSLPVIIDQAESVTTPLPVSSQVIRLIVSSPDTEAFRIRHREKE